MKQFYESEIEVMAGYVFTRHYNKATSEIDPLARIRDSYPEDSQQHIILQKQIEESWNSARTGKCGFLGSHYYCAFSVMYLVFGIDVIGFLFDQPWVPFIEIMQFNRSRFVQRVSILERSFKTLKEGDEIPVRLPEPEPNIWAAPVDAPTKYSDELHGYFLRQAFRELRDFGEAAKDLDRFRQAAEKPTLEYEDERVADVFIHLVHCYSNQDADRLAYAEYRRRYGPHPASTLLH